MAVRCPHCEATYPKMAWRAVITCPACGKSFYPLSPDLPPVAEQVRRDTRRSDVALFVLACFGIIGVLLVGAQIPALALVALLGIFALIARVHAGAEDTHPAIRIFLRLLAATGVLVVLGLVALAYLFVQCALGGPGGFR